MQKCCMKKSAFKIDDGGGRNSFRAGPDFANFRPGSDRRQVRRKDGKSVRTFATNWVDICFKYRKHRKAVPNFTSDYKGGEIQLLSWRNPVALICLVRTHYVHYLGPTDRQDQKTLAQRGNGFLNSSIKRLSFAACSDGWLNAELLIRQGNSLLMMYYVGHPLHIII